jgi:hypothetical protein
VVSNFGESYLGTRSLIVVDYSYLESRFGLLYEIFKMFKKGIRKISLEKICLLGKYPVGSCH